MRRLDQQKSLLALVVLVLVVSGVFYLRSAKQPEMTLYVPKVDLPAYHLISATDLITTTLPVAVLPAEPLLLEADLTGRYIRQALAAEVPLTASQLVPAVDEKYVVDTLAISIPATTAMTYNGQLASGAIVTIWSVINSGEATPLLDEALVLDVQKVEGQSETEKNLYPYVIVMAIPQESQDDVLTAAASRLLAITLTP